MASEETLKPECPYGVVVDIGPLGFDINSPLGLGTKVDQVGIHHTVQISVLPIGRQAGEASSRCSALGILKDPSPPGDASPSVPIDRVLGLHITVYIVVTLVAHRPTELEVVHVEVSIPMVIWIGRHSEELSPRGIGTTS
jgi:hypothetical protein